jgi:hypothetical protein
VNVRALTSWLFRGWLGRLRLSIYFACVFAFLTVLAARALRAEVGEASQALGRQLIDLPDVRGVAEVIRLNGARMQHARVSTTASIATVLDRFEAHCNSSPGPLAEVLDDIAANHPALIEEKGPKGSMRRAVVRHETESDGVLMCFVDDRASGLAGMDDILQALAETGDLSVLGQFRYVFAERRKDGRTKVVSLRNEGPLNVSRMFPATGDADGSDSRVLPRPPDSRRTLSASAEGMPYALRTYDSGKSRAELQAFYGAWMKASGWMQAAEVKGEGATAYSRRDGYQVFLTLIEEGGRTHATLIEAGALAPSPTAVVEISESP